MSRQIKITAFSEATGKVYKSATVSPEGPLQWDFNEETYDNALKSVLKFFVGKTLFFTDKKSGQDFLDSLKRMHEYKPLSQVTTDYAFTREDGRKVTVFMCDIKGNHDPVALMIKFSE